jgi:hypothetical protein
VQATVGLIQAPLLKACLLVVDRMEVGRIVVAMLQQAAGRVVPIIITGRQAIAEAEGTTYHAPNKELVTSRKFLASVGQPGGTSR